MTIQQAFGIAAQHHQAGRLADAEALDRQSLAVQPQHWGALHCLGLIVLQAGRHDLAAQWVCAGIDANSNNPTACVDLGHIYRALGRHSDSVDAYRSAVRLQPNYVEAHRGLGIALD